MFIQLWSMYRIACIFIQVTLDGSKSMGLRKNFKGLRDWVFESSEFSLLTDISFRVTCSLHYDVLFDNLLPSTYLHVTISWWNFPVIHFKFARAALTDQVCFSELDLFQSVKVTLVPDRVDGHLVLNAIVRKPGDHRVWMGNQTFVDFNSRCQLQEMKLYFIFL